MGEGLFPEDDLALFVLFLPFRWSNYLKRVALQHSLRSLSRSYVWCRPCISLVRIRGKSVINGYQSLGVLGPIPIQIPRSPYNTGDLDDCHLLSCRIKFHFGGIIQLL